ncbi:aryl-sulfate sulfotransferase [bacterium BMS3Abin03]|nr:aryl-sulfate sulfotransferase [bacterium BMS3Abin03]MCG6958858.1 aryl-sulfate sulfotransferase [bacterium BMS3Abin03]
MRIHYLKIISLTAYIVIQSGLVVYTQSVDAIVTVNKKPSKNYLFLGLSSNSVGHLWIVDNSLTPVFYREVNGTVFDFKYQPDSELTYNIYSVYSYGMDNSGTPNNQFFTPDSFALDVHDLQVLKDGSYYILGREHLTIDMSQYVEGGDKSALLVAHTIHHMDANDKEIWRWRSFDHYDIFDVDDHIDLKQHQIDWTHCNSLEIDSDGNLLLSTRNFDEITKIDSQTGDIIWRLGGKKNQFRFINDTIGFSRQHDVRKRSNGNLMMFDNGHFQSPQFSSYVEYKLNEDSLTATLIRRFSREESVYSESRGGIQELPDGNTLISWGENQDPCVTEFNDKGSIEYEIKFTTLTHQYRAYRFPWKTNYFYVNTDSLNFGTVSLGDSSFQKIWIKNTQHDSAIINEFYFKDSTFSVTNELPINIQKNDSVKLVVKYKPYRSGYFHDKLNIRYVNDTLLLGKQVDLYGTSNGIISNVQNQKGKKGYSLLQNYPNPFNPTTDIRYRISKSNFVSLKVYNALGKEVAILVNGKKAPGNYKVEFDGTNLPSGIYFYRLRAGKFVTTEKMVLLK